MIKNKDVCQNMSVTEILCYLRSKYSNVGSRSNALSRLKKVMMKKKDAAFCKQLKLSSDEYRQMNVIRRRQLMEEKMRPRLAARQMYFRSLHTIACSTTPGKLLPCLVFLTGLKPTDLFKNENDLLDPMMKKN